jgi:hypothetical protein
MSKNHGLIITSAIIWGVVIIACALALRGTGYSSRVLYYLSIGVIVHALLVWIPLEKKK